MNSSSLSVGLVLLGACAATPTAPARPKSAAPFAEQHWALEAEAARARAAKAEAGHVEGMFRSVELRTGTIGRAQFDDGDGPSTSLRLNLDRPFQVSKVAASLRAAGEAADFTLEVARREAAALACEESVEARALGARAALLATYRGRLEQLLVWMRGSRDAGNVDPLTASRTELMLTRRLLEARSTAGGLRAHPSLGQLPEPQSAQALPLDTDPARLLARIEQEHPKVREHLALASEYEHAATAERRSRLPWIDFVQLDYARANGAGEVGGRLSVEVPLDDGARGRAERKAHLSTSESYAALAAAAELAQSAQAALAELEAFESEAAQQLTLLQQAEQAEQLAQRFVDTRNESPERLLQLLAEAQSGRMSVIEVREQAGKAACVLEFATGTSYGKWPRVAVDRSAAAAAPSPPAADSPPGDSASVP